MRSLPTHSACTLHTQGYGGHVTDSFYALSIISKPGLASEAGQVRDDMFIKILMLLSCTRIQEFALTSVKSLVTSLLFIMSACLCCSCGLIQTTSVSVRPEFIDCWPRRNHIFNSPSSKMLILKPNGLTMDDTEKCSCLQRRIFGNLIRSFILHEAWFIYYFV
jgi:hypothetical protein